MTKRTGQISRLYLILASLIILLSLKVWYLQQSFQSVVSQSNWIIHTSNVISELDLVMSAAKDAETGVRGYLLTGQDQHLEPYTTGVNEATEHLANLSKLIQDNPTQKEATVRVKDLIERRFTILEELLGSHRKGSYNPGSLKYSEGKILMDSLRQQINLMKQNERELLQERTAAAQQSKSTFAWILYLSNIAIAVVMIISFFMIARAQSKALDEAEEKTKESAQKDLVSRLAKQLADDLPLNTASEQVLKFLAQQYDFIVGKMYVADRGRLFEAAALGLDSTEKQVELGLVTAAFEKRKISQIHDVPENYWQISSGLGSQVPKTLTFIPFQYQGRTIGLIEFGSFGSVSENHLKSIQGLSETIAIGINSAQSRSRLQDLLETTQQQSEELQAQQEELRASNEELEQQARALESQQQALNIKNQELESTRDELEVRAEELERSTRYKSEFLAKMSHELRTPLNGLLILSTLLIENKEKNLTEQQSQFAKSIHSAGNDLLTLINDILDLSKIEARKLSMRAEEFTLGEIFRSLKLTFDPQAHSKGILLETQLPANMERLTFNTDRQRVDQILRNFISNALKFTDKGSIQISALESTEGVRIAVKDSGIGIPREKQHLIFEAFEQADSSVSRRYGGTGLGLTISRELAQLLGGHISLESEEGKGSTFILTLPRELPSNEDEGLEAQKPTSTLLNKVLPSYKKAKEENDSSQMNAQVKKVLSGIPSGQQTILVVEDDDNFRLSIVEAAKSYGFHPIEAGDGELALAVLKAHVPSAILLDIKLPGISGLGILEMIKHMPHLRHIPVHMISGLDYQQNALRMGALGYLTKPVTIDKVKSALNRIEQLISNKVRKTLLIEDDEKQSMAVSALITGPDIEVVTARTGKEALEKISSNGFDCVILDLSLPDISGFDLLREMSRLEISLPPIVIYTGKDLTEEEDRYLRKFSESIIIKGARSPERLLDEVNLFLHRVESLLPESTQELLSNLRSQERSFEGKTVLIVDDDVRNIFALTSALETKGLHIRTARDGIEALEALDKHEDIDLVLMDIMMPRMDGFEAMGRIRSHKNPELRNLPIIALTAKAMKEDHERCIAAGASDYIPKPINLENLTTVLRVWLSPKGLFA